jgi:hypothetical protein
MTLDSDLRPSARPTTRSVARSLTVWAVPAIALITGLAATITWWVVLQNDVLDSERRQFAEVAARIVARIDERMVMTEQMIVGIAAIVGMDAGGSQFRDWGEYITRLSLDSERDLPPTAGFIPRIERAALGRHEQQQRAAGNAN